MMDQEEKKVNKFEHFQPTQIKNLDDLNVPEIFERENEEEIKTEVEEKQEQKQEEEEKREEKMLDQEEDQVELDAWKLYNFFQNKFF